MHPYREPSAPPADARDTERDPPPSVRALQIAYAIVVAWALLRGAVAAYQGRASSEVWLAAAVIVVVLRGLLRTSPPRRPRRR
jgi:hypothetical protein